MVRLKIIGRILQAWWPSHLGLGSSVDALQATPHSPLPEKIIVVVALRVQGRNIEMSQEACNFE